MQNESYLLQLLKELSLLFKDEKFEEAKTLMLSQTDKEIDFEEIKKQFLETLGLLDRNFYVETLAVQIEKQVEILKNQILVLENKIKSRNFLQKLFISEKKDKKELENLKNKYKHLSEEYLQVYEELCTPSSPPSWQYTERIFDFFRNLFELNNQQKPNYKQTHQDMLAFYNYLKSLYK